ncbi:MAG: DNA polymerase beta protein [uncultured bacterium]|uniref:Polymerase nucleotidyl transferase domain-containing protein n=1 Tax=candidate division WWE3 bacterium RBG_16_37_10 TaxID=1802610 RepID=A0A1F4V3P7_UNCKA|nr:MAG: DNA polymerase beta protein [uncultured bacterium]OGC51811.1 MAG: hypothetical protein A2W32_02105 [candidate division WWE3 bacterium RBG_16_37_10]
MDKKSNRKKVNRFIEAFTRDLKSIIPVEKVILFGSYATNTNHPDSDVDLAFISPSFEGMDYLSRLKLIGSKRRYYDFAVDYFGFTPEEYENASPLTTLGEIRETGEVLNTKS